MNQKSPLRKKIKLWLLSHPKFNPFNNFLRMYTSPLRLLPDVIIGGFHKTSSTSLHYYLTQHPEINPVRKEIGYFSMYFWRGEMWYKSHFPTIFSKFIKKLKNKNFLILDSDPGISYYPNSPQRVFERLPNVKLIFILRNPIDRAFSHYNHDIRKGWASDISFEEQINDDDKRYKNMMKILQNTKFLGIEKHMVPRAYLSISKYVIYLKTWFNYFPKKQILILTTDEINENLDLTLTKITNFLNISKFENLNIEKQNVGKYSEMNPDTRAKLIEFFKPYNLELEKLLDRKFNWDK